MVYTIISGEYAVLYILVMTYHSETKSSGISIIYINGLIKKKV